MNDPESIDLLLEDFPDLAHPKEVADLLRVRLNTVNQWIREGRLLSINAGRRVNRIMKPKLREFLLHADEMQDDDGDPVEVEAVEAEAAEKEKDSD